jgi:endoglucanase
MSETSGAWRFSRRELLHTALNLSGAALVCASGEALAAAISGAVTVHEITMAAPDIVCVEVRDQPVSKGALVNMTVPDSGAFETWQSRTNPTTGRRDHCMVVGPDKTHLRFQDMQPTEYLNRSAATMAADYGAIGANTVTAVYLKSMQYSAGEGFGVSGSRTVKYASMKHFLFLKLNGPLMQGGPYTIRFPPRTRLPNASFTFNDRAIRAIAIRGTQVGHRPRDVNKLAYLALWIPGAPNEGAINLSGAYGLNSFSIIDEKGNEIFKSSIKERVAPTTMEENSPAVWRLASTSRPKIAITGATTTNPVVITAPRHGLTNSEVIAIYNMDGDTDVSRRGLTDLNNAFFTVAGATTDTFALAGVDGTHFTPYQGGGGTIYRTYAASRAGTYVYGLDYSAWNSGEPGTYRIHVPGLGVSDPFEVSEEVWHRVAWNSAKGEYHQRSGCTLDGRFGYRRPSAFNGSTDVSIRQSALPYAWTNLAGMLRKSRIDVESGVSAPWITGKTVDAYGGWFDAGDYVTRIADAAYASYMLLDVQEHLPSAARSTKFNIPLSSQVLDPSQYSAIDMMPDVVHQAIWNLDCFRRLQSADGSVSGGMGMSTGLGTNTFEPSWLYRGDVYLYAPDHFSTLCYAGAAAKLATVLGSAGFSALAMLWRQSAVSAWNWAYEIYTDRAARDAYYAAARTKAGWDDVTYAGNISALQDSCSHPAIFAAATIFRLTGESRAGTVFTRAWSLSSDCYLLRGAGAWEYYHAAKADRAIKREIGNAIINYASNFTGYSTGRVAYRNCQFKGLNPNFGGGGMTLDNAGPSLIRAHLISTDQRQRSVILGTLQAGLSHIHGANQVGLCFTSGLGSRNTAGTLHADAQYSIANGIIPAGITNYAWSGQLPVSALNFNSGPLNYIVENASPMSVRPGLTSESDFENERQLSHPRICFPQYEAIYENPFIIEQMEFTTQQTIIPQEVVALYLHGWDANTRGR